MLKSERFLRQLSKNGLKTKPEHGIKELLFDAVWCGDSETLTQEMNKLLRQTISYHDYREDFYLLFWQAFLQELDIWFNPIRNMEKAAVIWLLWILKMAGSQFLRRNIQNVPAAGK